jgi:hypothetical protein
MVIWPIAALKCMSERENDDGGMQSATSCYLDSYCRDDETGAVGPAAGSGWQQDPASPLVAVRRRPETEKSAAFAVPGPDSVITRSPTSETNTRLRFTHKQMLRLLTQANGGLRNKLNSVSMM